MKKQFKRVLASLLVLVMVLAMLPTIAIAAETYTATPLTELPTADQTVVIYSASAGGVFAGSADGGAVGVSAAAMSEENGSLNISEGAGVYKLVPNSDGTYYITCGGKYLHVTADEKLSLKDTAETGTKWNVTAADGYDGYTISNAEIKYNNKYDIYVEYYGSFKAWTCKTMSDIYVFKFFEIDASVADADGDGYVGTKPVAGALPKDGDKVVIYNEYGGACFGAQSDDPTAPSLNAVESTMTADGLEPGNGSLIFTVHYDGSKYYTFENNGKYLRTSENAADGSNAECLYFDTVESDYTKWYIESCTGGYIIYNKIAKYKSNAVCIEHFGSAFSGWTFNGSTNLFAMNFYTVEDELGLGYVLNPKVNLVAENAFLGADYEFEAKLDELAKVEDIKASFSVDGGAEKSITAKAVDGYKYSYTIPSAELAGGSALTLKVTATNEYGMQYSGEKTVEIKDEPIIISVSPASNEATGSEKRPEITVNIANCGTNPTVEMTLDGAAVTPTVTADKITYKAPENMTDDRHAVAVTITRADGKKASMEWSFFVGEAGISLYFGQMHSHTAEYSDGAGQLEDAYEYAKKANDVDYLFVTDHSNYFDTTSTATTSSYYDLSSLTKIGDTTKWEQARATAASYTTDDFIAAYGYEMTWSGGPGHTNSFNTYGPISRNNSSLNNKTGYAGMHLYNDLMANANRGLDIDGKPVAEGVQTKYLEDAPVISQFNHPGTTFGTFDDFAGYTPTRDSVLCLVEVGNGEGQVGGSSYWPSYSEYDKALAKGWHVAPSNNQDNHKGKWGDANTCRDVVVTDDFTEAGLYRAMSERRVYATEDQNLRIYYYLNGELMGSIIDTTEQEVTEISISASISDPDGEKLGKIEVIGENGISLASFDAPGATYELKTTLPNTDAYYYLKVTQADGDIAVTAPVWLGAATPITAAISTDAALSVVGQKETITISVTNAAEYDFELDTITLSLIKNNNEIVLKTIEADEAVAVGSTLTKEIEYVRSISGEQTLKVVFTGMYNGKEFKAQASMEQKVYKANELKNIGIDYGHGNFYVSGGYSDNMGNFIQYAADNGISANFIQKGEFTYENIKNFEMIALTVPFDTGKLSPSVYTADELAALQRYVAEGGNLIVTTKSDRKSPTGELNCAAVTNSILEAVGSNVRAANGIIVDNELKSNEAYRIYFSSKENFNTEHRFTAGAYTSSNAFGTVPATDNQTGFQLYNAAPILINEGAEDKVTVLVNGYQSTWGASYTDNFDGSSYVPDYNADTVTATMGDVNIMTYEELPGGGWLITSGCTFFSNYDIKDDTDYANKFIVNNILRELTGVDEGLVISDIKDVKAVPEDRSGEEYTIEGYITSNASAYDQDTAFFDCIYMEDKDGNGINCFPVAGNYAIGMNVRAHGGVTYYCGEVELNLGTDYNGYIRVISDELYKIEPKEVTCETAMADATIGNLMKITGLVVDIHKTEGVIDKIYVRDDSGTACLFINGYIMKDYTGLDELKIGMTVSGVGIGSRDVDETSATSAIFSRLRVRDRSEIKILDSEIDAVAVFDDVNENDWYVEAVQFSLESGLLTGTSAATFSPNTTLTRATVATVLYRLAGSPKVENPASFSDVAAGLWYSDAIAWAQANGIVGGYENGTFKPNGKITRQEMAVMLVRYAKTVGVDVTPSGNLDAFTDNASVAAWAVNEMTWCVDNGIIGGVNPTTIAPLNNATRAQFATIVMRFVALQNAE